MCLIMTIAKIHPEFIELVRARMSVRKTSGQIFDYSLINDINTSKKKNVSNKEVEAIIPCKNIHYC